MHLFRSSKDIRPSYGAIITNLLTVDTYNSANLTGPGCWAYPDMLEVGVTAPQPPGALHHCATPTVPCEMNETEWQTHFSAWCIVSSPLILGMDLTDSGMLERVWPIITNREVLAINEAWVGDSGRLVSHDNSTTMAPNCGNGKPCEIPRTLVYAKQLPVPVNHSAWGRSAAAVLLVNNDNAKGTVTVDLDTITVLGNCSVSATTTTNPSTAMVGGCAARDAVARLDLSNVTSSRLSATLEPHASQLIVLVSPHLPLPPSPSPAPAPPSPSDANCTWIPGAGLRGGDIKHTNAPTKEACCADCAKLPGCKAACFRPQNHTGPGGAGCHMKNMLSTDPGGQGDSDAVVCVPQKGYHA